MEAEITQQIAGLSAQIKEFDISNNDKISSLIKLSVFLRFLLIKNFMIIYYSQVDQEFIKEYGEKFDEKNNSLKLLLTNIRLVLCLSNPSSEIDKIESLYRVFKFGLNALVQDSINYLKKKIDDSKLKRNIVNGVSGGVTLLGGAMVVTGIVLSPLTLGFSLFGVAAGVGVIAGGAGAATAGVVVTINNILDENKIIKNHEAHNSTIEKLEKDFNLIINSYGFNNNMKIDIENMLNDIFDNYNDINRIKFYIDSFITKYQNNSL